MTFADVLLPVIPSAANELVRLSVAADLALRHKARLDGLFVAPNGGDTQRHADWARTLFERTVQRTSLETSWRVVSGASLAPLLYQARRTDLTILPSSMLTVGPGRFQPEFVALESGRPAIVLPPPTGALSIGHRILVGWNETREAARAVHDAMPILETAESVCVLTVIPEEEPEPLGDGRLADHLRQHGVAADLVRLHGDPAERIAETARHLQPDILVLGLTRHDGEGESLGEVSRRFVRTNSVPIFLSH